MSRDRLRPAMRSSVIRGMNKDGKSIAARKRFSYPPASANNATRDSRLLRKSHDD